MSPSRGTPRELLPTTERVLSWVAAVRKHGGVDRNDVRAIELCALATREACMFFDLYGIHTGRIVHRDPEDDSGFYVPGRDSAPAPEVQVQR